jgi:ribose 5-phosphate isomerase B
MVIYIGSDHAGFDLKESIKEHLEKKGKKVVDLGNSIKEDGDDYPDFILPVAREVSKDSESMGIVLGGSGESIAANKIKGIRCATYHHADLKIIKLSREHNNSNVLSLGARFLSKKEALDAVDLWLSTDFTHAERHVRRLKKIDSLGSQ